MGAVPRKQVIHPVQNTHRKVGCVDDRFDWQTQQAKKCLRERLDFRSDRQLMNTGKEMTPPLRRVGVATPRFIHGKNGSVEKKALPLIGPPVVCSFLVIYDRLLATRVRCQVAGNRRFNINGLHLPETIPPRPARKGGKSRPITKKLKPTLPQNPKSLRALCFLWLFHLHKKTAQVPPK